MNEQIINVLDKVSFETADGLDYLTGIVWDIAPHVITFRVGESYYAVPRYFAEESTILIEKFSLDRMAGLRALALEIA